MTTLQTDTGRNKLWEKLLKDEVLRTYARNFRQPGFPPSELPTEDDLPYDDGEPMETPQHHEQMDILIYSLRAFWKKSRKYYIGGNMFLHFDLNRKKKFRGPDFFLVTDADDRQRKSWVVWQEGMRFPDLIIELLSDTTRKTDRGEKKELYQQVFGTSEYYIYDPFSCEFEGYRLSGGRYKTVKPDKERKIYSPVTGLWLIVRDELLRWMTEDGYILPTYEELSEKERQRAEQAEKYLITEKLRAERLAAKLRELGISPEAV